MPGSSNPSHLRVERNPYRSKPIDPLYAFIAQALPLSFRNPSHCRSISPFDFTVRLHCPSRSTCKMVD
ncbi:hypothetical protein I3843_06G054900 [Carya illinoinensis]|nr:hypothetical protein I3843_06G054900 [Carya illinoinensis]